LLADVQLGGIEVDPCPDRTRAIPCKGAGGRRGRFMIRNMCGIILPAEARVIESTQVS
jgi:hypothetical protein